MDESRRLKIKEIIERVPQVGIVHEYERWSAEWSRFLALFTRDVAPNKKELLGWEITRERAPGTYLNNVEEEVIAIYLIRGYMAVSDADRTDILFNRLVDAVRDQFRADFTLGGLNVGPQGFNVDIIEYRTFGNVLCHYCEIRVPVQYITA